MRVSSILLAALLGFLLCSCVSCGDTTELDDCQEQLRNDALTEATLEVELDARLAELKAALAVVETFKWYRDDNRTDSGECLKNLTLCNVENEFKIRSNDVGDSKKSLDFSDLFKGGPFSHEKKVQNKIAYMQRHFNKKMNMKTIEKHRSSKHKRDIEDCDLKRCQDWRQASAAYQNQLELSIQTAIERRSFEEASVSSYQRFSMLYDQLRRECLERYDDCLQGMRMLRATFVNGPGQDAVDSSYFENVTLVFFAFTPSPFSPSSGALAALSVADASTLADEVTNAGGFSATKSSLNLGDGSSETEEIMIDPAVAKYAWVAALFANGSVLVAGDSFELFDNEAYWVGQEQGVELSKRAKRYIWPDNSCPLPRPVPEAPAHKASRNLVSIVGEEDGELPYASIYVEEIRLVPDYPEGIPDEAFDSISFQ